MQTRKLARQIQANSMTRNGRPRRAAMKPLEDMFLRIASDRAAGIANLEDNMLSVLMRADSHASSAPIVLSRVLQKIVHDYGCIAFLPGNRQVGWDITLD